MLNKQTSLLIFVLACLFLSGCRTVSSSGMTLESHCPADIHVGSKIMHNHLKITKCVSQRRNGLMAVTIRAENLTNKDLQCEYRYTWFDADGLDIETGMSIWKPANFHGKARVNMSAIAPSKNVNDYKLVLRFTKSSTRF